MIAMIALFQIIAPQSSSSATVRVVDRKICKLLLEGPIETGDVKKLEFAGRQLGRDVYSGYTNVGLCLKSSGGSFSEAIKIADFLYKGYMPTIIPSGAKCYSACAIVFMAGNRRGEEANRIISRRLHVNGELGFHSPYLAKNMFKKQNYSREALINANRAATLSIKRLIKTGKDAGESKTFMPMGLLVEMLSHGPEDLYKVDTVWKAIAYKIELFGYRKPRRVTKKMLCNACMNWFSSEDDSNPWGDREREPCVNKGLYQMMEYTKKKSGKELWFHNYGIEGWGSCLVRYFKQSWEKRASWHYYSKLAIFDKRISNDELFTIDTPLFYPGNMPIKKLR